MRKQRFIVEMINGRTYGVYAFNFREAGVLVQAWCILIGMIYDPDFTTGTFGSEATRRISNDAFECEWSDCRKISLEAE